MKIYTITLNPAYDVHAYMEKVKAFLKALQEKGAKIPYRRFPMQGKVEICGVNTARLKVLTQKQMDSLLIQAKNGDENARQELIAC